MKKIVLFICSFDGVATRHSGVGTAIFGYLSSIPKLSEELRSLGHQIELHVLTNKYKPTVLGYNKKLLSKVKAICKQFSS